MSKGSMAQFGPVQRGLWAILTGLSLVSVLTADEGDSGWLTDFSTARRLAREQQKPLLVSVTASWCGPCRQMRQLTFADDRVKRQLGNRMLAVMVDADHNSEVVASLGVTAYPTTILFDTAGNIRKTWTGYQSAGEFATELEQLTALNVTPSSGGFDPVSALYPQNGSRVAFGGFCLVSLLDDNKLRRGQEGVTAEYHGQKLSFATPQERTKFLQNPSRYWPVANGKCMVTDQPGDPRVGVRWQGRLWFFADRDRQQQFIRMPHRYSTQRL